MTADTPEPVDGLVGELHAWAEGDIREVARDWRIMGPEVLEPADLLKWADLMDRAADAVHAARQRIAELAGENARLRSAIQQRFDALQSVNLDDEGEADEQLRALLPTPDLSHRRGEPPPASNQRKEP